jgi:penicillin-binding protein 2
VLLITRYSLLVSPLPLRYNLAMLKKLLLLTCLLLAACSNSATPTPPPTPTVDPSLPPAEPVAQAFLAAWEQADYNTMYSLVSSETQAKLSPEAFANRYTAAQSTATTRFVRAQLRSTLQEDQQVQASYHVEWDTALFGTLKSDYEMTLSLQDGQWRVAWEDGLVWPDLKNGGQFQIQYQIPRRANIYDSDGKGLAVDGKIVTIGVVPGQIEDEATLLAGLSPILNLSPDDIKAKYASAAADWFVPLGDVPFEITQANAQFLKSPGIQLREDAQREYKGLAAHVVGYIAQITADNLQQWKERGYRGDEWVGATGLEAWGEPYLAGTHGGTLTVIGGDGSIVKTLADRPATPSRSIYTTIDRPLQEGVEKILAGHTGAIVVMNPQNGAILAMASYPTFDPNALISAYAAQPAGEQSFLNRATQGAYPPGSTFKPVTMAAGLEKAGLKPTSTFFDPGYWDGLGQAFRKWNWNTAGDGTIDFVNGLSRSNNTVFYEVGKRVQDVDQFALPNMARAFGLGHTTGITGVEEVAGQIPDPDWKQQTKGEAWVPGDGVNMAIGQGDVLATPLQMVNMYAAIANGGTIYRPRIVQKIGSNNEPPEEVWQPEVMGKLPVSPENLQAIQQGLHGVISSPGGTAGFVFRGFPKSAAGKTGTAEAGGPGQTSHAWFVVYAPYENPEIVVLVFLENGGQGSYNAAPLARQVLETYYGLPLTQPPAAPPPGPADR